MTLRSWATPLTIGSFLLIAVTGVLMFFHLNTGLNKAAHEWLGWFLLVGVGAHLWLNWRAFSTYFNRRGALAIMGVFVAVLLASFAPISGGEAELPIRQMVENMTQAPLESVAVVAGKTPDAVLADLAATYPQVSAQQSISDLTGGDMEKSSALLAQVFAAQTSE